MSRETPWRRILYLRSLFQQLFGRLSTAESSVDAIFELADGVTLFQAKHERHTFHIEVNLFRIVKFKWSSIARRAIKFRRSKRPPPNAQFLFYLFMDARNCESIVGDLEERYRLVHKKFGRRRANFWYWTQALRSVVPIAWAWLKRASKKPLIGLIGWAAIKGLISHD